MMSFRGILLLVWIIIGGIGSLAAQDASCDSVPVPRLIVGGAGRVSEGESNNVRSSPDLDGEKSGTIPGGQSFTVIQGPVCADGFNWWQVDYNGLIGWTVEGQGADYWLEPLFPAVIDPDTLAPAIPTFSFVPPLTVINQLGVGVQARVLVEKTIDYSLDPSLRFLYAEPTVTSAVLGSLEVDSIVTVVGGPQDKDGYRWWQVEQNGVQGWSVEGTSFIRQLLPACPKTENRVVYTAEYYLYTADADGSNRCVFDLLQILSRPVWSPDRQKLLFLNYSDGGVFSSFPSTYQMSIDGLQRTLLVDNKYSLSLDYSPNGQRLLSVEELNGSVEVWIQSLNPSAPEKTLVTTATGTTAWAGWLDEETILFWDAVNNGQSGSEFYTVSLSQGTMTPLFTTDLAIYNADGAQTSRAIKLSPDRTKVSMMGHAQGNDMSQTLVFDTHTGEKIVRFSNAYLDVWSPDGTQLLTLHLDDLKKGSAQADARPVITPLSEVLQYSSYYGDLIFIEWLTDDVVRYISRDTIYHINPTTGEVTKPVVESGADG